MSTWTEMPTDRPDLPEGDIGGDIQRSDAWGKRFYSLRFDGTYDVVTIAFYLAAEVGMDTRTTHIERQSEWIHCTDHDDPGGTEIQSDYAYARESTSDLTEAECKRLRDALTPDDIPAEILG